MRPARAYRRIAVIGSPGSGKTWLARHMAQALDLPHVELDRHFWQRGWVPAGDEAWLATVRRFAAEPAWVIDGNHERTLAERLERCDWLVFMDLSTASCLLGVVRRLIGWKVRPPADLPDHMLRPGRAPQVSHRFLDLLRFVATFRRRVRPRIRRMLHDLRLRRPDVAVTVVASRRQARALATELRAGRAPA